MPNLLKQGFMLITGIIVSLGLSLSLQSIIAATWVPPSANAPASSLLDLINVGGALSDQTIGGKLNVTNNFSADVDTLFVNASNGRVGIGTNNPQYSLDVNGTGRFTGDFTMNDSIHLNVVDSIFFENDKHAITYNDGAGNFNIRIGHTEQEPSHQIIHIHHNLLELVHKAQELDLQQKDGQTVKVKPHFSFS